MQERNYTKLLMKLLDASGDLCALHQSVEDYTSRKMLDNKQDKNQLQSKHNYACHGSESSLPSLPVDDEAFELKDFFQDWLQGMQQHNLCILWCQRDWPLPANVRTESEPFLSIREEHGGKFNFAP